MMKTMTTKDLLVFAVLVIIQPFVSLAQMPVIQRISVPNSETINAMAIDPDRQVWYLLAKKQDALSLVSVSINGSINWFYNSIITNYADDKNINPIINQPLAKPQLAVDPISGDVLVSGWTSTGPIYGFNFGAVTVTETEGFGWNGICWSPKLALFVVVGQNQSDQDHGAILVSADGILWTELKGSEFVGLASVTWSPALEIFVAVGTSTNGITFVYTSRDGYEWVRVKSVNTLKFKVSSVRWSPIDGGCFFAAGYSTSSYDMAIIMRSCGSAIDWTSNMIMLRNDFIDIPMAISPELKVVILMSMESNGTLALSFDNARTWEFVDNLMPLMQPFGIAWSPTVRRFVAIGTLLNPVTGQQMNGRIITSSYNSYLNWTFTHNVTFEYLQYGKIAWYDDLGMFIVSGTVSLGEGVIFTSQDGLSWTKHSVIFSYWYIFAYSSLLSTMLFLDQSSIVFTVPFYYQAAGVLTRFDAHGKMKWYNQYGNDSSIIPNGLAISQSESVSVVGTQFITNGQLFGPLFSRFNFTDGNEISNFEFDLSISMNEMLQNTLNRLFEEVEARIHPANGQVPISTPTILPVFHFFSQDSTYDQTSGLFISVGNLLFSDGYQIYTFSFISSWPLNESNVQLEILDLPTFASIQLDSWSKQALVLFTNDPINSWSIAWIPIQSIGNITSMKNTSISSTNVKNSWIPAPHYNNQLAKPKYFALYAVRLNQGGHALSISSIKSDNSSVQYFTVANSSTDFMTELRVARIYYDSEFPILALAGNFNSGPLLLLVNATILLSDFDVAASSTRSFFSSTTMFLGKPINPQQPSQNTLEVVYIGLVAGISVAAIVAVGILIYRKNVIKAKIRQRQTEIESQVELNNFNINPAISSHMDQEEIIRIHNNDLKRGVGDTAEISSPVLSPISIKNYSDSTTDSSKNMESGILNGATSTLYASGQRGKFHYFYKFI
jgi:hypothetical protein